MKKCTKCKEQKDYSAFHKNKFNKDNLQYNCKKCVEAHRIENKEFTSQKKKIWYQKNKERLAEKYVDSKMGLKTPKAKYIPKKEHYIKFENAKNKFLPIQKPVQKTADYGIFW